MNLHDFETILKFGQHEGETVAETLKNNPTYIQFCYRNYDDFYVTDAVWEALDCDKDSEEALKSGRIDPELARKVIAQNKNLHEEKRNKYKKHMMETYEHRIEKYIKGNSNEKESS